MLKHVASLSLLLLAASISAAPELAFDIIAERKHDSLLFTQGLVLDADEMIESSGLYGRSFVRRYSLSSGETLQEVKFPKAHFAEGLTIVGNKLYVLTWREHLLYIFDKDSLKPLFKLSYAGEGWGLAFDGTHLIMSDGSDKIFYRDKKTFNVKRSLAVTNNGVSISALNELEYANNAIWANVWRKDTILQINPLNGEVAAEINLSALVKLNGDKYHRVLNGIAYDKGKDAFWITGKRWQKKYLIKLKSR